MERERILDWFANVAGAISDSIRENVRTLGGAFCGLFVASFVVCSLLIVFWNEEKWDSQGPIGVVADISGASFAVAVVLLSFGRVAMSVNRIFKTKEREQGHREGREEGREEGRRETANEYTEADANRLPGETLQQAVDRLRKEKSKNG